MADNGKPPLSSLTYVDLRVIEESVYPPAILPLEIFITAFGEEYSGGVIGKIHATDQDVYDTLTYSLDAHMDKLFSVSSTGGKLIAHKKLDVGQYLLNVSVTDGRFTTVADITVHIRQVTQEMLNHSITLRFANLTPEEFVGDYWRNFQRALRNILGLRRNDIQMVSLQPSEPPPHLDVLLFVEKSGSAPISTKQLLHKINSSVTDIEEIIGVRILDVFQKLCAGLDCPWKFCDEKVTMDENVMSTHSTARLSFVTPRHLRTAVCLCTGNTYQSLTGGADHSVGSFRSLHSNDHFPEIPVNELPLPLCFLNKEGKCPLVHHGCEDSPCPEGSECVPDPGDNRYSCVCPGGKFGPCPGKSSVMKHASFIEVPFSCHRSLYWS